MREIGMGQGFRLVAKEQHDVAGLGLSLEQLSAQARPIHSVPILTSLQRVAGPSPAEIPFWRSTTDSREGEMRRPARLSISSARRGSVQFGRSPTGLDKTSSATASARSASPRSRDRLRAISADLCSSSTVTGDLPANPNLNSDLKTGSRPTSV